MKLINKKSQSGFTLVEMSVVLVVIGLILGAVSIGKDVQRNAEYAKIKQKFVDQWASVYNEYYMRSGVVLGDSQIQPTMMVNGVDRLTTVSSGTPISGADMTSVVVGALDGGLICQGALGQHMTGVPGTTNGVILHKLFDRIGLRMPPGRAEGSEDRYLYLDSNGNPQELQVCFK